MWSGSRQLAWSPDGRRIAVLTGSTIDLHDPDAMEPPTRISSEVAFYQGACLSWSAIEAP